jgi:mRNA-degrading endonuclease RelE of RelBE toxin-antitoxin system
MGFKLRFSTSSADQLSSLQKRDPRRHKKALKCLGQLELDPKYPGLNSHRYEVLDEVEGQKIWESYVENRTPGAYRVFWHYGPGESDITIIAITPHP